MASHPAIPMSKVPLERTDEGRARFRGCTNIRDFEILEKLGEGTFGEVYKARSKRSSSIFALKKILMHNERDGFPITALREIKLLKMLSHVNILRLDEMAIERSRGTGKKKASMYMVTPYMEHDLSGLLENPNVQLTEPQIKCYMLQLLEGLRYLHDNRILHPANLLISNKGILQIADFGLARPYDEDPPKPGCGGGEAQRDYTVLVVTRWYRPPELLLKLSHYTTAIDIWGVGCVFGEMFKRKPILTGSSDLNQLQLIFDLVGSPTEDNMPGWQRLPGCDGVREFSSRKGNLNQFFREQSPTAQGLLHDLLLLDWRKRLNAIDALSHPYFHTPPLPARPGDLPSFEDSHELDRRKFRTQKANLPPAPQGGQVGMGAEGQWAGDQPPRMGGRDIVGSRPSRIPMGSQMNGTGHHGNDFRRGDSRVPYAQDPPPHHRPWRDGGIPPRPPQSNNLPWNNPPWERGHDHYDRHDRHDRRDRIPTSARNDRGGDGMRDTYIPSYQRDENRRHDERPDSRGRYGDRPDERTYMRRRSRSPRDRLHEDRLRDRW